MPAVKRREPERKRRYRRFRSGIFVIKNIKHNMVGKRE